MLDAHSLSPVPLCHIANELRAFKAPHGKLADISPTLLTLMGLEVLVCIHEVLFRHISWRHLIPDVGIVTTDLNKAHSLPEIVGACFFIFS